MDAQQQALVVSDGSTCTIEGVKFSTVVLTLGYWPSFKIADKIVLPKELRSCMHMFEEFYREFTCGGRRLQWDMQQGQVQVLARFWTGEYDLVLPNAV